MNSKRKFIPSDHKFDPSPWLGVFPKIPSLRFVSLLVNKVSQIRARVGLAISILISVFVQIVLRLEVDILGLRQQFSTRLGCTTEEEPRSLRIQKHIGGIKEV